MKLINQVQELPQNKWECLTFENIYEVYFKRGKEYSFGLKYRDEFIYEANFTSAEKCVKEALSLAKIL